MSKSFALQALVAGLCCAGLGSASAVTYRLTDLGTLGGTNSGAAGINDAGQVVGYSYIAGLETNRAFLWDGTQMINLGTLAGSAAGAGTQSGASAINNAGQIAGGSDTTFVPGVGGPSSATLWSGTQPTNLGTPSWAKSSYASAINKSGQVVGAATLAGSYYDHAVLWTGSQVVDLGTLAAGGRYSSAAAINDAGLIVGQSDSSAMYPHATLWKGSQIIDLGTLGKVSGATSINNAGDIVGYSDTANNGPTHAVLWKGSQMIDLNVNAFQSRALDINNSGQIVGQFDQSTAFLTDENGSGFTDLNTFLDADTLAAGWHLTAANAINDEGWIVGTMRNQLLGVNHAFLLSVVPEPETYALMLTGLGLIGWLGRRRKAA